MECKAHKVSFETQYGHLAFVFMDHEHALICGEKVNFDGIVLNCSVQVYCKSGQWFFNTDILHVRHAVSGADLSGAVAERAATILLDEFIGLIKAREEILKDAKNLAELRAEEYLLSEIAKHERIIDSLKQEVEALRIQRRAFNN